MRAFFKWTAISVSAAAAAALAYRLVNSTRLRLERGLQSVERVAEDAQAAVARTQEALGQTARTVHEIRRTIS